MIVILDFDLGNIASISNMLNKIDVENCISSNPRLEIGNLVRVLF